MGKKSNYADPIVRHDVESDGSKFKWGTQFLAHISRYEKAADLIVSEAAKLGRPVDVLSVGCGNMGELRYLVGGLYVKKSDVLRSYTGIDISEMECPLGEKLLSEIDYNFYVQDISDNPVLPVDDESVDLAVCLEIIEHMEKSAAQKWVEDLSFCMRKGGLVYFSTPNAKYSHSTNKKYHPYEWDLDELLDELTNYWDVEIVAGSFINERNFNIANSECGIFSKELVDAITGRFGHYWSKTILAAPYPKYSASIEVLLRA